MRVIRDVSVLTASAAGVRRQLEAGGVGHNEFSMQAVQLE